MSSVEIRSSNSKSSNSSPKTSHQPLESLTSLNCMYLNATSLENKLDEFKVVVKRKKSLRYTNCSRKWKDTDLCKEY